MIFKWGTRPAAEPGRAEGRNDESHDVVSASKVLPRFLAAVGRQPAPVLLDLGPVVGSNVEMFGERLACKLLVQDLYGELGPPTGDVPEERARLSDGLHRRLPVAADSVDGILCWDLFDYLDSATAQALAAALVRVLKPGGVVHAFFAAAPVETDFFTRFVVEAEDRIRHRTSPAFRQRRHVRQPGDIARMFAGLQVSENVLLKASSRETLLRKP